MKIWNILALTSVALIGCETTSSIPTAQAAIADAQYLGKTLFESLQSSDSKEPHTSREADLVQMIQEKGMSCEGEYLAVSTFNDSMGEENLFLILSSAEGFQFGRHFRFRFKSGTNDIIDVTPSTKTCINVPNKGEDVPYITHLISPTPSEFHVYLSLKHEKEIYVSTSTGLWSINDGVISKVKK